MDGLYSIGMGFAGATQGLEKGLQSQAQIEQQGFNNRLALQKFAKQTEYQDQQMQFQKSEQDMKMQQMEMQIKKFSKDQLKSDVFNAFNGYMADGNPRWLNQALQENKDISKVMGGVLRVDKIDPNEDTNMLQSLGITEANDNTLKRFMKATYADGSVQPVDIHGLAQATGAWKQMTDDRISQMLNEAHAAYYIGKANGKDGEGQTALQKNVNYLNSIDPKLGADFLKKETGYAPTATTKELNDVDTARKFLLETNPKFFETTYQPGTTEYRQLEPSIQRIEKNLDIKLNSTDKKEMADIKRIITLGDTAKNLTEEDTGMIDNLVGNIGKYISSDAPSEAKNAYSQMMTTIRNSLYGATVPTAEMQSFTQAFGSLYQQDKSVKSALKTSLEAIKTKMEVFADTGDEAVTHFRYGADAKKLDKIISNLDLMIGSVDGKNVKSTTNSTMKPNIPLPSKEIRASDDYKTPPPSFNEGQRARNPKTGESLVFKNGKWVAE